MRRRAYKLLALLLPLVFQGMVVVDATGLHGCPQHDQLPGQSTDAPGHAGHHAPDGHDHAAHHAHGDAGHDGDHEGPCTCIGNCHVSGESAAIEAPPASAPGLAEASSFASAPRAAELLPGSPSFLLPYSHGPPLRR